MTHEAARDKKATTPLLTNNNAILQTSTTSRTWSLYPNQPCPGGLPQDSTAPGLFMGGIHFSLTVDLKLLSISFWIWKQAQRCCPIWGLPQLYAQASTSFPGPQLSRSRSAALYPSLWLASGDSVHSYPPSISWPISRVDMKTIPTFLSSGSKIPNCVLKYSSQSTCEELSSTLLTIYWGPGSGQDRNLWADIAVVITSGKLRWSHSHHLPIVRDNLLLCSPNLLIFSTVSSPRFQT